VNSSRGRPPALRSRALERGPDGDPRSVAGAIVHAASLSCYPGSGLRERLGGTAHPTSGHERSPCPSARRPGRLPSPPLFAYRGAPETPLPGRFPEPLHAAHPARHRVPPLQARVCGYSKNEVSTFLRAAADALSQATLEREELGRMLRRRVRGRRLPPPRADPDRRAGASEKIGEDRRAAAQKEAERIVGERAPGRTAPGAHARGDTPAAAAHHPDQDRARAVREPALGADRRAPAPPRSALQESRRHRPLRAAARASSHCR